MQRVDFFKHLSLGGTEVVKIALEHVDDKIVNSSNFITPKKNQMFLTSF